MFFVIMGLWVLGVLYGLFRVDSWASFLVDVLAGGLVGFWSVVLYAAYLAGREVRDG